LLCVRGNGADLFALIANILVYLYLNHLSIVHRILPTLTVGNKNLGGHAEVHGKYRIDLFGEYCVRRISRVQWSWLYPVSRPVIAMTITVINEWRPGPMS